MAASTILRTAGWSAYASGIVAILGLIFLGIFFSIGEPYGSINDLCIALQVLLMLPIGWGLYRLFQARYPGLHVVTLVALVIGALTVAIGSVILVLKVITFEQSLWPVSNGFGLIGIWLLAVSVMALNTKSLPAALAWFGIVIGAGMVVQGVGYWIAPTGAIASFSDNMVSGRALPYLIGAALTFLGYPIWAIWLGAVVVGGKVAVA